MSIIKLTKLLTAITTINIICKYDCITKKNLKE